MLGQKRNSSMFQNAAALAADSGNQPQSNVPELTTEIGNRPEATPAKL